MALNKSERQTLFNKYYGKCAYCGCELKKGWHADHIEAIRRDWWDKSLKYKGDVIENMNPYCPKCNINKHQMSIEEFRRSIENYIESLNKRSVQYQMSKKYGLIQETKIKVEFYFEKVNNL